MKKRTPRIQYGGKFGGDYRPTLQDIQSITKSLESISHKHQYGYTIVSHIKYTLDAIDMVLERNSSDKAGMLTEIIRGANQVSRYSGFVQLLVLEILQNQERKISRESERIFLAFLFLNNSQDFFRFLESNIQNNLIISKEIDDGIHKWGQEDSKK